MSKVKHENYIVVQGWMINGLNLKGNLLLVYAIVYGFSQAECQKYSGGLQYIADWINSTKRTAINCLNELIDRNLIEKEEKIINGIKFCEYRATDVGGEIISLGVKKMHEGSEENSLGVVKNLHQGGEKISPNNIDNNLFNNKEDIKDIVEYMNMRLGTNYKPTTKATVDGIKARLKEGFTVDDFKTVIDKKCVEWMGTDMEKYLRPQTLFGNKFETYLNQPVKNTNSSNNGFAF